MFSVLNNILQPNFAILIMYDALSSCACLIDFVLLVSFFSYLSNFSQLLADSKPEFLEPYYETNVTENTGPGHEVVQVGIKERPLKYNSTVRYRLDKKAMPYFAIDEDTGVIMTAGELLNWNVMPVMTFPVYAYEDRFPNITAVTFVRVLVSKTTDLTVFCISP